MLIEDVIARTLDLDPKIDQSEIVPLAFGGGVGVEVEEFEDDRYRWQNEMTRSDDACHSPGWRYEPFWSDQKCCQDVPKDGIVALEEGVH